MSELTDANISNIDSGTWTGSYVYEKNGNMVARTIQGNEQTFDYNGLEMTNADGNNLAYDENGQLTTGISKSFEWNWDGKLKQATIGGTTVTLKYDPMGNRVYKDNGTNEHRYIVDWSGSVPVVLLVLDAANNNAVLKRFVHTDNEVLMQYDSATDENYYYLHDRLGSVREVVDANGTVKNNYTYDPWGNGFSSEIAENISNPYRFAGYFWDDEIGLYYCIARYYDPVLGRFTSRDPVKGAFKEPMTLHVYLYCINNPINATDPDGRFASVALSLVIRAAIGATIGGYSSYKMSGGDEWATTAGIIAGAVSGMLGHPTYGVSGLSAIWYGAGLGGATNAFALSRKNPNDDDSIVYGGFVGVLTGGLTGGIGTFAYFRGLDLEGGWATAAYATTEFIGWLWGENLWMPYQAGKNLLEKNK